jgi:hypothetical protein
VVAFVQDSASSREDSDSEPYATADLKSEIVAEEGLVLHGAVGLDRWPWILQGSITDIDTHVRLPTRLELDTATDVERERGVTRGELTRNRRWKDRDASKRIGRFGEPDEAWPELGERSDRAEARPGDDAEQTLDAARAECGLVGEV